MPGEPSSSRSRHNNTRTQHQQTWLVTVQRVSPWRISPPKLLGEQFERSAPKARRRRVPLTSPSPRTSSSVRGQPCPMTECQARERHDRSESMKRARISLGVDAPVAQRPSSSSSSSSLFSLSPRFFFFSVPFPGRQFLETAWDTTPSSPYPRQSKAAFLHQARMADPRAGVSPRRVSGAGDEHHHTSVSPYERFPAPRPPSPPGWTFLVDPRHSHARAGERCEDTARVPARHRRIIRP